MNPHRKGNSFDAGVPGDPRLLDAINRRTPRGAGMQVTNTHGGVILANKKRKSVSGANLPFQISVGTSLIAAPGVLATVLQGQTVELAPANGTWYLEAKVVINATTGAITAATMDWVSTPSTNTSTDRYGVIGTVDVVSGVPDPLSISQGNYGPLIAVAHGGVSNAWEVSIF